MTILLYKSSGDDLLAIFKNENTTHLIILNEDDSSFLGMLNFFANLHPTSIASPEYLNVKFQHSYFLLLFFPHLLIFFPCQEVVVLGLMCIIFTEFRIIVIIFNPSFVCNIY